MILPAREAGSEPSPHGAGATALGQPVLRRGWLTAVGMIGIVGLPAFDLEAPMSTRPLVVGVDGSTGSDAAVRWAAAEAAIRGRSG